MTVSDYIVDFFVSKGIHDFFGYQGTMIAYFVDAIHRNADARNHSCYNEQGASFAACGYGQVTGKCGVAYSTSGPGAVNLLSGIANAYFDSEPAIFITGQLNTYEYTGIPEMRQQGFQEIDIVSMAKPVTKYAVQISDAKNIRCELEKAWYIANNGRKGSVLLDLPMNIQRTEIVPEELEGYVVESLPAFDKIDIEYINSELHKSKRPLFLVGNGVTEDDRLKLQRFLETNEIPFATSLLAKDFMGGHWLNVGNVGNSYGNRLANLLVTEKTDLIVSVGISLKRKQLGTDLAQFGKKAELIRIEIDGNELKNRIKENEIDYKADSHDFIADLKNVRVTQDLSEWHQFIDKSRRIFTQHDSDNPQMYPNKYVEVLSDKVGSEYNIISDVGQHMMWMAQSFKLKFGQKVLYSGGHGAMGYSLPASIGAYWGNGKPCLCVAGDGSFQMNIQELQWVVREHLPIKIVVFNNHCLGMIRSVQEDYLESRYEGVSEGNNYDSCRFVEIAKAYGIKSRKCSSLAEFAKIEFMGKVPELIEVNMANDTLALPKTFFGDAIYNQRPYIDQKVLEELVKE